MCPLTLLCAGLPGQSKRARYSSPKVADIDLRRAEHGRAVGIARRQLDCPAVKLKSFIVAPLHERHVSLLEQNCSGFAYQILRTAKGGLRELE
jgi:hypothetical protein